MTNLIGSPYFPDLTDHVLFLEDISEGIGRLKRMWHQWEWTLQTKKISAVFLVSFLNEEGKNIGSDFAMIYGRSRGHRTFRSLFHDFGHVQPNATLGIGAQCEITSGTQLTWKLDSPRSL